VKVHYSSKSYEWETPIDVFQKLNLKFNNSPTSAPFPSAIVVFNNPLEGFEL